ncbi:MAG: Rieske 2Fe-2S domain-containing protein [Pseudomonadales bacterium]|nr:Rieske 2Fe-2S domain-containing protein [Pseudomonadales bacterium]
MIRRTFLGVLSSLVGMCAMPGRWIRAAEPDTFVPLREIVTLPAESVPGAWTTADFNAFLKDPGEPDIDKMLKGILIRTDRDLQAYCIYCPHEVCMVTFREDTSTLKLEQPREETHPLMVCPCHFSAFDPLQDGAKISGPAWRGLYRFRVEQDRDVIHITGVERNVLTLYN